MKKNLGRLFLAIFIFVHGGLFASTYTWSAASNKKTAYVGEPIYLQYVCAFSDRAELFSIEFNPPLEHEEYTLKPLGYAQTIVDGKKINSYEFLAFAKKAGEVKFEFEALMKETTEDSVEEMIIGRDNVKKEEVIKKSIKLDILKAEITETNSSLVGDFKLEAKRHEPKVKANEPYHLRVTIKGEGNFEALQPLFFEIEGVKVFASEVEKNLKLGQNGQSGEWSQRFAFVGERDFSIPEVKIEYFNTKTAKKESLILEAVTITVEKGFSKEELLDKPQEKSFEFDYDYLYYLLIFIAGFLAGKIEIKREALKKSPDEEFKQKIDKAKSLQELAMILVLHDPKKYERLILDIENKKITSLKSAKKLL